MFWRVTRRGCFFFWWWYSTVASACIVAVVLIGWNRCSEDQKEI